MLKKYAIELLIAIGVVLAPIKSILITVGVLIVADFAMGLWAARKRGESITSSGMSKTVSKALVYQAAVICAFLVEKYLMDGVLPVCKIVASIIGSVEMKSLLENGESILGQPVFKVVIDKLKSQTDKDLGPPPPPES